MPLLVTSGNTNQVLEYNGTTGAYIGVFATTNVNGPFMADGNSPSAIVQGPDGNVYLGYWG